MNGTVTHPAPMRITPRLIAGIGILTLGILWTLDNLDLIESERITEWWPLFIIAAGVARLLDPRVSKVGSAVIIAVGTALLLDTLDYADVDVTDLIPLGIALLGGKLVMDALGRRSRRSATGDPNAHVSAFAMMAGLRRQSTSREFRGGDVNAIMGGVELDLRNAHIADGEEATIDVFAFWGGIEIVVPQNWRVVGDVLPLLGSLEDKTLAKENGPVLIVRGAAIMGAVEVKN